MHRNHTKCTNTRHKLVPIPVTHPPCRLFPSARVRCRSNQRPTSRICNHPRTDPRTTRRGTLWPGISCHLLLPTSVSQTEHPRRRDQGGQQRAAASQPAAKHELLFPSNASIALDVLLLRRRGRCVDGGKQSCADASVSLPEHEAVATRAQGPRPDFPRGAAMYATSRALPLYRLCPRY